jgi:hypothetical protein
MKLHLPILLLVVFSNQAVGQFTDFPTGMDGVPEAKLKGPVHSVLTIEQRGERVFSTVVEVYDTKGKLLETLSSNAGIEIHSGTMVRLGGKTVCTYDGHGRLARELSFTPEGEYTGYEAYIYDSKDRLIETRIYDGIGKETGTRTHTYSPETREVVATWSFYFEGRNPMPTKNILSYNEKWQWTKRTEFDPSGNPADIVTFDYDSDGNFIKETTCCKYNFSHSYSYQFDNHGNWVERRNTYSQPGESPDPEWMRKYRVITYYSDSETKALKK